MITLLLNLLVIANTHAGLVSSMPATYLKTGIPNSHLVNNNVIRSMAPRNINDIDTLLKIGVTDFLIFKNEKSNEVVKEISLLEEHGVSKEHITHLDFLWKDITDFRPICEMTIEALKKIEAVDNANGNFFFIAPSVKIGLDI